MLTRFARITSRLSIALTLLLGIVACGGGGGSDGGGFLPNDVASFVLDLTLIDGNGNPTSTVSSTTPATLQVAVTGKGTSAESVLVTATTTIGLLIPEAGTALTNSDGIARLRIEAGDTLGAGTITVSVEGGSGTIEKNISFQVGVADLRLGYFEDGLFIDGALGISPSSLSSGGTTQVTVAVVDGDAQRVSTVEMIKLDSECLVNGQAGVDPVNPVPTVNGQANIIYTAAGCQGDDLLTATLDGGTAFATGTVSVAGANANSIAFTLAEPEQIALKGTGGGTGRQERSQVSFQVIDSSAAPISGVVVRFALSTEIGGLKLENPTAVSNVDGIASAIVTSGTVATSVRVIASIEADDGFGNIVIVSTLSDVLIVSSGLPDQDSISIAASQFVVPRGMNVNGVEVELTVTMGDHFNNPVPDGTSALFTTEYGLVEDSCITTEGQCTVTWRSSAPRFPTLDPNGGGGLITTIHDPDYSCPSHNGSFSKGTTGPCPDALGGGYGGRSTVLVTAVGEEFFVDRNGNGVFDQAEAEAEPALFENLPEAFLDHNEDWVYTPTQGPGPGFGCQPPTSIETCEATGFEETFSDFNNDNEYNLNIDPNTGKGVYNGILCPVEGDGVWCSRELVNVRSSLVLILSDEVNFDIIMVRQNSAINTVEDTAFEGDGRVYIAYVSDFFNNPPATGSTVSIEGDGGSCNIVGGNQSVSVPDIQSPGAFGVPFSVEGDGGKGTLTVKVAFESGGSYSESFACTTFAPIDDCSLSPKPPGCP